MFKWMRKVRRMTSRTPVYAKDLPIQQWVYRWKTIRIDEFKDFENMRIDFLDVFEAMCLYAYNTYKMKHRINSDYRKADSGQHGKGNAIDFVLYKNIPGDTHYMIQYLIASRFDFGGIGYYPFWNTPGCHADGRENRNPRAGWWRGKNGKYHALEDVKNKLDFFSAVKL